MTEYSKTSLLNLAESKKHCGSFLKDTPNPNQHCRHGAWEFAFLEVSRLAKNAVLRSSLLLLFSKAPVGRADVRGCGEASLHP